MSSLGDMVVTFSADISQLTAGVEAAKGQIAGVGSAAQSAAGSSGGFFSNLLGFGSQVGMTVMGIQGLYQGVTSLGSALLGPAAEAEQTSVAFTTLMHSSSAAAAELDKLNSFAAQTPFKTTDINNAAESLLGFGYKAKDIIPNLTAIGDTLSALGKTTPVYLDSLVGIFGKIQAQGKLTGMDIMQMGAMGIDATSLLAKGLGVSSDQIAGMMKKGIDAQTAIMGLKKGMEETFGGGMQKQAETFDGLLSTFQSNIKLAWVSFSGPLFDAAKGALVQMGNLVASPGFQQFAKTLATDVAGAFGAVGGAIAQAWPYVQSFFSGLMTQGKPAFEALQGLFSHLDFSSLQGMFKSLAPVFSEVSGIVGGTLSANFQTLIQQIQQIGQWFNASLLPAIKQAMPGFQSFAGMLIGTVVPALAHLWSIGEGIARAVMPVFIKIWETALPILLKIGGFIGGILGPAIQFLTPYLLQAAQAVGQFVGEIAARAMPIITEWGGVITGVVNAIIAVWNFVWPWLSVPVIGAFNIIMGTIKIFWSLISGAFKIALDLLSGNWSQAWSDIKDVFSGVWDGIKMIFKGAINWIIGMLNNFIGGIDSLGIDVGPVHIHPNIPKIPLLAGGGFLAPGQLAIAGEAGPEFVLGGSSGTSVVSASQTASMLSGAGGDQTITIYLDSALVAQHVGPRLAQQVRVVTGFRR